MERFPILTTCPKCSTPSTIITLSAAGFTECAICKLAHKLTPATLEHLAQVALLNLPGDVARGLVDEARAVLAMSSTPDAFRAAVAPAGAFGEAVAVPVAPGFAGWFSIAPDGRTPQGIANRRMLVCPLCIEGAEGADVDEPTPYAADRTPAVPLSDAECDECRRTPGMVGAWMAEDDDAPQTEGTEIEDRHGWPETTCAGCGETAREIEGEPVSLCADCKRERDAAEPREGCPVCASGAPCLCAKLTEDA